jgi:hypothetical protein
MESYQVLLDGSVLRTAKGKYTYYRNVAELAFGYFLELYFLDTPTTSQIVQQLAAQLKTYQEIPCKQRVASFKNLFERSSMIQLKHFQRNP